MKLRKRALVLAAGIALALVPALPAAAHVPPDTGPGGQAGCITDTHDPAGVATSAPDNTCG